MNNNKDENIIRVLHVVHGMDCGGAENFIMNVYRKIDKSKIQFDFLVHTNNKCYFDDEILKLGGIIYQMPYYYILNSYKYKRALNEFFISHPEIKIVHGHLGSCSHVYLSIAKNYNCYTIAHCHSGRPYKQSIKNLLYLRSCIKTRKVADYFYSCCYDGAKYRYGNDIINHKDKFSILENAIDLSKYKKNPNKRMFIQTELNIQESTILFGHIGSFYTVKNHRFLLKIFSEIYKINNNTRLILIGDGPQFNIIKKAVSRLRLNNAVIFTGMINNVEDYLQRIDCIIFPSLYEGLPVTLVEAQASGIPCLISNKIPKDINLTTLIHFLTLKDSAIKWANKALKLMNENGDRVTSNKLLNYDVNIVTNKLEDFYISKIGNKG